MIVVVGGGIIGLACAWRLAQQGMRVHVTDAGRLASEASDAAAGMLAPGGEFEGESQLASLSLASLSLYAEFVRELERESGAAIDYRLCGALEVAFTEHQYGELERRASAQLAMGIRSERASHDGHEARFYPDDALVNPRHVTAALIAACRRRDVRFFEQDAVWSIDKSGRSVRTRRGTQSGDAVLVAAGAWSSDLYPGLRRSFPVRGHLIGWASEGGSGAPILRNANTYLVQRADGSFVAGSSTESAGFDRSLDRNVLADIRTRVKRLLPSAPVDRAHAWNGLRPGIDGDEPAIGVVEGTHVYFAYGHYRNGILLAPETARRIGLLIASS